MTKIKIDGLDYNLATNLRVAFKLQGQHNHKPYTEIFQSIGTMPVQEQIGILWAAFESANKGSIIEEQFFMDYVLDNYTLKDLIDYIQQIVAGIMGTNVSTLQASGRAEMSGDPQLAPELN